MLANCPENLLQLQKLNSKHVMLAIMAALVSTLAHFSNEVNLSFHILQEKNFVLFHPKFHNRERLSLQNLLTF